MTDKALIPSWPVRSYDVDPLLKELFIDEDRAGLNRDLQTADRLKNINRAEMRRQAALAFPTTLADECRDEIAGKHKLGLKPRGWINRIKGVE